MHILILGYIFFASMNCCEPYLLLIVRVPMTMLLSIAEFIVFVLLLHSVAARDHQEDLFQRFVGDQDILLTRGLHIRNIS